MSNKAEYHQLIAHVAKRHGVPPEIALAVAQQESSLKHADKHGYVLARYEPHLNQHSWGLFQLLTTTAQEMGVDPMSVDGNIDGGVRYLKKMFEMTGTGKWSDALTAYNGGIGNWRRGRSSTAAKGYAVKVLARAQWTDNPGPSPDNAPAIVDAD